MSKPLPQYVKRFLDRFENPRFTSGGWTARCPCPQHGVEGDKNGDQSGDSLRISIGGRGQLLLKCHVTCATSDVLQAVGLSYRDCYATVTGEEPMTALAEGFTPASCPHPDLADRIFRTILSQCPLTDDAIAFAGRQWGFSRDDLEHLEYGFMADSPEDVVSYVYQDLRDKLLDVPGFVKQEDRRYPIVADVYPQGRLLIPLRDPQNRIQGFKCRALNDRGPRYLLWGAHICHMPRPRGEQHGKYSVIRLTEGEAKADHAWLKTGIMTVSAPGVGSWKLALPLLETLQPAEVLLALDWLDIKKSRKLAETIQQCYLELCPQYTVGLETWNEEESADGRPLKGIDDALRAGIKLPKPIYDTALWLMLSGHHFQSLEAYETAALGEEDVPPFPLAVFPEPVRHFIEQTAKAMQTAPDFSACAALATVARCIGASRLIDLRKGWKEPANLYMVIVAPPSSLKTPTLQAVMDPLIDKQYKDGLGQRELEADYKRDLAAWKKLETAKRKTTPMPEKPAGFRQLLANNITVEALIQDFQANYHHDRHDASFLYCPDEIVGFIKSVNAYRNGRGADYEFYLSTWSGAMISYRRKTNDERINLKNAYLSIIGGVQPDKVGDLAPDFHEEYHVEDGFLPRFLFSYPRLQPGYKGNPDPEHIPDELLKDTATVHWRSLCERLLHLSLHEDTQSIEHPLKQNVMMPVTCWESILVPITDAADHLFREWCDQNHADLNNQQLPKLLRHYLGKARGYIGRLALVLYYIRVASAGAVDEHAAPPLIQQLDIQNAILLMDYFRRHFVRLHQKALTVEEQKCWELCRCIKAEHGGAVTLADIYKNRRLVGIRKKDLAQKLCQIAVNRCWGYFLEIPAHKKLGRPKSRVFITTTDIPES